MINVFGPRDRKPNYGIIINCTSQSKEIWSRELSPFFLGPVILPSGAVSQNMENAWQFSKVYEGHDTDGLPNEEWYKWSTKGFTDKRAHRYPMGKGAVPFYSWDGSRALNYIEARKHLYWPLYAQVVVKTRAFERLSKLHQNEEDIHIFDFDGYDFKRRSMSYEAVLNYTDRPMGHGLVLAGLLEGVDINKLRIKP